MCSLPATSEHTTKCTSAAAAVYISPQSGSKLPFSPFTRQPLPSAGEPPKCGTQKIARARSICLCLGSSNSSSLTPLPTTASGLVRMMGKAATVHARGPLVAATLFLPLTAALHYFQCFQCALPEIELSPPHTAVPSPAPSSACSEVKERRLRTQSQRSTLQSIAAYCNQNWTPKLAGFSLSRSALFAARFFSPSPAPAPAPALWLLLSPAVLSSAKQTCLLQRTAAALLEVNVKLAVKLAVLVAELPPKV